MLIITPHKTLIANASPIELSLPLEISKKTINKNITTEIKKPLTISIITGCSFALKLAIKTLIITSTRSVNIKLSYFLLGLSLSSATAFTAQQTAYTIIFPFENTTIPEALLKINYLPSNSFSLSFASVFPCKLAFSSHSLASFTPPSFLLFNRMRANCNCAFSWFLFAANL